MNIKLALIGLAAFGFLLSGCNSGDSTAPVSSTDLVGNWGITKGEVHISDKTTPAVAGQPDYKLDTVMALTGKGYYINLKSDMTYTANVPGIDLIGNAQGAGGKVSAAAPGTAAPETGTWSVSGNTIKTISSAGDTLLTVASISGVTGTFSQSSSTTQTDGGYTYTSSYSSVFTATKQ